MTRLRDHSEAARLNAIDIGRPTETSQGPTSARRLGIDPLDAVDADGAVRRRHAAPRRPWRQRPDKTLRFGLLQQDAAVGRRDRHHRPVGQPNGVEGVLQRLEIDEHPERADCLRPLSSRTG